MIGLKGELCGICIGIGIASLCACAALLATGMVAREDNITDGWALVHDIVYINMATFGDFVIAAGNRALNLDTTFDEGEICLRLPAWDVWRKMTTREGSNRVVHVDLALTWAWIATWVRAGIL